jgi:hypothetical protein
LNVICIDDVAPLKLSDIAKLMVAPSLEAVCSIILSARKTDGLIGTAAREAVDEVLTRRHPAAVADLIELLPADLAEHVDADWLAAIGLHYICDEAGNFAAVGPHEAVIGSRVEIANRLAVGIMRGLRRAVGGYEAARAKQRKPVFTVH